MTVVVLAIVAAVEVVVAVAVVAIVSVAVTFCQKVDLGCSYPFSDLYILFFFTFSGDPNQDITQVYLVSIIAGLDVLCGHTKN